MDILSKPLKGLGKIFHFILSPCFIYFDDRIIFSSNHHLGRVIPNRVGLLGAINWQHKHRIFKLAIDLRTKYGYVLRRPGHRRSTVTPSDKLYSSKGVLYYKG
jgi:hypothetical protein